MTSGLSSATASDNIGKTWLTQSALRCLAQWVMLPISFGTTKLFCSAGSALYACQTSSSLARLLINRERVMSEKWGQEDVGRIFFCPLFLT